MCAHVHVNAIENSHQDAWSTNLQQPAGTVRHVYFALGSEQCEVQKGKHVSVGGNHRHTTHTSMSTPGGKRLLWKPVCTCDMPAHLQIASDFTVANVCTSRKGETNNT